MENSRYIPTPKDVERYRKLRALALELNSRITKTIPREALEQTAEALGFREDGVVRYRNENNLDIHADCCFYDWRDENGLNVVERYRAAHPAEPGSIDELLLDSYCKARFSIFGLEFAIPDAGVYCRDMMNGEELFIMDIGLSNSLSKEPMLHAGRIVPIGGFWMTTGAGMPISDEALDRAEKLVLGEEPFPFPVGVLRACIEAGDDEHVAYRIPNPGPPKRRLRMKWKRRRW